MHGERYQRHMGLVGSVLEKNDDRKGLPELRRNISSGTLSQQVLQQGLSARGSENGKGIRSNRSRAGASFGDGSPSGEKAHEPPHVKASEDKGMRELRGRVQPSCPTARAPENLLEEVSVRTDIENTAREEFMIWLQLMRGELSRLPTVSAGWIWMEPEQTESKQLDMFGGGND